MIKLNIQLFGGENAADRQKQADPDGDGFVTIPALNGETYKVPASLFSKIDADSGPASRADEEVREAKVWMSYYLTYGEAPTSTETLTEYGASIGLGSGVVSHTSGSKAYQNYVVPGLKDAAATGRITDTTGQAMSPNRFKTGYSKQYGMPVAKNTDTGSYVYKDPNTGKYVIPDMGTENVDYGDLTGYTDMQGNPIQFANDRNDMVNPDTGAVITPPEPSPDAVENAKEDYINNRYYEDLYSGKEGTLGKAILDNNISLFEKEAQNAATLADTSMQSQAIQQAQAVKQVTDSVRSERAAQLRAGMSESQLADRELQMLMGSVNQMSDQAQMASQEATAAQLGKSTARENAFNQYIEQTTTLGQNASANYASHVGDANAQAEELRRKMAAIGINLTPEQSILIITGQTPNTT